MSTCQRTPAVRALPSLGTSGKRDPSPSPERDTWPHHDTKARRHYGADRFGQGGGPNLLRYLPAVPAGRRRFIIVSIQLGRGAPINASISRMPRHNNNEFVHDSWPVVPVDDWSIAGLETQGRHPPDWLKHSSQK